MIRYISKENEYPSHLDTNFGYKGILLGDTGIIKLDTEEYRCIDDAKWVNLNGIVFNSRYSYASRSYYVKIDIEQGSFAMINDSFILLSVDGVETLLYLKTNKATYISKKIRDYKPLWVKISKNINLVLNGSEDVIYTNDIESRVISVFEKPKFKSLAERHDYCDGLLTEVLSKDE